MKTFKELTEAKDLKNLSVARLKQIANDRTDKRWSQAERELGRRGVFNDLPAKKKVTSSNSLPDHLNPDHMHSNTHHDILGKIVRGELDPVHHAKKELANRGLDSHGKWVGPDKAHEHHFGKQNNQADARAADKDFKEAQLRVAKRHADAGHHKMLAKHLQGQHESELKYIVKHMSKDEKYKKALHDADENHNITALSFITRERKNKTRQPTDPYAGK